MSSKSGIYKIVSPSNKIYVGQTWNYIKRFNNYRKLYCKTQTHLYRSFVKYGFSAHTIELIHELPEDCSQEVVDIYEKLYLEQYKSCGFQVLNLREPGSRGKHSQESIERMKGKPRIPSTEVKERIAQSLKNHYKSGGKTPSKKLIQKTLEGNVMKEWESGKEAAESLGIKTKGISRAATGKNKNNLYMNFVWEFK